MSKYTTEVRFICESKGGFDESQGADKVNEVLSKCWDKIFDSNFPIFDEAYRSVLCQKILKHFYLREICCETVGVWKLWLNERMEMIMPFYNQLYQSATLEFNPLYDVDLTTTHTLKESGDSNATTHGESTNTRTDNLDSLRTDNLSSLRTDDLKGVSTNENWNKYSDTPQGALTGIETDTYLTDARRITDNGSTANTGTQKVDNSGTQDVKSTGTVKNDGSDDGTEKREFNTLREYTESVRGKRSGQTYSKDLLEYRQTMLNIDKMVIDELNDLFFLLW